MSLSFNQANVLVQHRTAIFDVDLVRVGVLAQIYLDETSKPLWAAVVFDQPSDIETVVPIHDAHLQAGDLVTSYPRTLIQTGPRITAGDELPWVEEERLRNHYGQHTPTADVTVIKPISEVTTHS